MASSSNKRHKSQEPTVNKMSFTPREYQIEILEAAKKDNVIACLGTGTGKTFIAVMLIRENDGEVRKPFAEGGKRIFFLVPTVPLVTQQKKTIADHTSLTVRGYYGDMGVDTWNKDQWIEEFTITEVLVMTAEIFRIIVDHAFISLDRIQLLIIDECHRAQGDHPYRQALKCFTNLNESEMPRIFGLSASLLNGKCKPSQLETNLRELERTLRSTIITASDITDLQKYGTDPDEYVIYYNKYCHEETELTARINELITLMKTEKKHLADINVSSLDEVVFFDKPLKCLNALLITLELLGPWCANKAAEIYNKELRGILLKVQSSLISTEHRLLLEDVQKFLETFINKCNNSEYGFTRKNILEWPNKLKRLFDIFIAVKKSQRFSGEPPVVRNIDFNIDPEKYLREQKQMQEFKNSQHICSIIFVQQRITAYVLCQWILEVKSQFSELEFLMPEYIVGHGSIGFNHTNMSEKKQQKVLSDFRKKKCNALVATCVLEEGMDIRQCNVVIRFDLPPDFRAYVQSKGRARSKNSIYPLLVEYESHCKFLQDMCSFKTIEKVLISKCHDRNMPTEEEITIHNTDDALPPYMPYGVRGPRITITSAVSLINRYCASLPCDMATKLTPTWKIRIIDPECVKKQYECTLRMPINSSLRKPIVGEIMKQKKLSKMAAALKACQMLHELGELNENLVPISFLVDNALVDELGPIEEEITDGAQPGTNRRRQVYEKKVPIFLKHSRPLAARPCYLHFLNMKLVDPLPRQLNPRGRPIIDPSQSTRGLGILTCRELPSINSFPVFTKSGTILVTASFLKTIDLQPEDLSKLEEFHQFIFSDAVWLAKEKMFSPSSAEESYFIVPVNKDPKSCLEIDWDFIEATKSHPYNKLKLKSSKTVDKTIFCPELFTDAVVMRSYMLDSWKVERPNFHHVINILFDKSPVSKFDTPKYETYKEYYKKKYDIEIEIDNQPLIETVQNAIVHLWKPIYVSEKQSYDDDPSYTSNTKLKRKNYREYLVPELCIVHPFPSSFMYKVLCVPTILFRIRSLLLAEEIRQTVATQGFIGVVQPNVNISWPDFYLQSSDKALKQFLYKNCGIKFSSHSNLKHVDVVKDNDTIVSFEAKVQVEGHPGPDPSLILRALTTKSAGDEFDLERLEMIGDSFLKYVMSVKTYIKYPLFDEGKLTKLRSGLIQNLHLYQCAKKKNIAQYLICTCFSCSSTWLPPCYHIMESVDPKAVTKSKSKDEESQIKYSYFTKQIISDKCLADSIEALIGAYLLSCGQKGALMFMSWMGLNPLPIIKDCDACREDFETWPSEPSNPIICDIPNVEIYLQKLTNDLNQFENIINYKFKNKAFLLQAFTHPSYSYNEITDCYQRLEFLGDAVLDYLITRQLYEDPHDHSPGKLTDLRSALVNNIFFASLAVKYKYHKFLKMLSPHLFKLLEYFVDLLCNSEAYKNFEIRGYYLEELECFELEEVEVPKALGDVFESVAGAIYLDSGMSLDVVWTVYKPMIAPAMKYMTEHVPISPVRELYEFLKTKDVFGEAIQKGDKTYIEVKVNGKSFVGVGPNKKVAKRSAAKRVLSEVKNQQMDTS